MSSLILSNDFEVHYANDTNGDKQIKWNGTTGTYTVNQLYSAIQNLFDDESGGAGTHMNEGVPMSTQTPTEYTIGEIESNDSEPWFIDEETIKHLKGGSLQTTGWTRTEGTDIGIIIITYTGTPSPAFDSGDIGAAIVHSDTDAGKLLHYDTTNKKLWIRPDSNAAINSFDSASGTMNITGGPQSLSQSADAPISGENIWANIFFLGALVNETEIYVSQETTKITQWWDSEDIDILVLIQEMDTLIDKGYLTVYARQYATLFDHFIVDVSLGGRNPIPLVASDDINNDTGYVLLECSGGSGTFVEGEVIGNNDVKASATALGVITDVAGTSSDPDLTVYMVGDLTDFTNSDTVESYSTTADGDVDTVSAVGPTNLDTDPTFTFGADNTKDLSDGKGPSPYNVIIDCKGNTLSDFYEYTKYLTRRGYTTPLSGKEGQQYLGTGEIYLEMLADGNFAEGDKITGTNSQATGYIVANHVYNPYYLTVRDVRGTFENSEQITDETSGDANTVASGAVETISLSKVAPFGTLAGGQFFGARGVWIENMHADDANNYQLTDSEGDTHDPPASVSLVIDKLASGDRVAIFRASSADGPADKTYLTSETAGNNNETDTTFVVQETIPADTPASGILKVVDKTNLAEQRYSYTSYIDSTFSGIVKTFSPGTPGLDRNYNANDKAYVPYIDVQTSSDNESVSVTYVTDRDLLIRVRLQGIVPYSTSGTLRNTGYSGSAIRNPDPVA